MNRKVWMAGAVSSMILSAASHAALVVNVNFKALPISDGVPELTWTGNSLIAGLGAQGNGDGNLPDDQQGLHGLQIGVNLVIGAAVPGKVLNLIDGSTVFSDVTLVLDGVVATGPAFSLLGQDFQPIGPGIRGLPAHFELRSTNLGGGDVLLLAGDIASGNINGQDQQNQGLVLSGEIAYTGGVILQEAIAPDGIVQDGSLSWDLLNVAPPLSINGETQHLNAFNADAAGQFSFTVVPEPASLGLIGLAGLAFTVRRRIRKA